MTRSPRYRWHLRQVMDAHGMRNTTELAPLLKERGIDLSPTQIYRLVTQTPERLSLPILAALCDIFGCGPGDLIETYVEEKRQRRAAGDRNVVDLNADIRPKRARIKDT